MCIGKVILYYWHMNIISIFFKAKVENSVHLMSARR